MKFQDAYEATLASYSKILHPNHHVMIDLEFTLVQLYGRERSKPPSTQNGPDSKAHEQAMVRDAKRKLELCEKVISVISKLMPGKRPEGKSVSAILYEKKTIKIYLKEELPS